jgi:hypothetical protein
MPARKSSAVPQKSDVCESLAFALFASFGSPLPRIIHLICDVIQRTDLKVYRGLQIGVSE